MTHEFERALTNLLRLEQHIIWLRLNLIGSRVLHRRQIELLRARTAFCERYGAVGLAQLNAVRTMRKSGHEARSSIVKSSMD